MMASDNGVGMVRGLRQAQAERMWCLRQPPLILSLSKDSHKARRS